MCIRDRPVSADVFQSMNPLFNETTEAGKIRYTIGVYNNITRAIEAKEIIVTAGINNSFITAFYNSKRITLIAVSYTHLDVYKRQDILYLFFRNIINFNSCCHFIHIFANIF